MSDSYISYQKSRIWLINRACSETISTDRSQREWRSVGSEKPSRICYSLDSKWMDRHLTRTQGLEVIVDDNVWTIRPWARSSFSDSFKRCSGKCSYCPSNESWGSRQTLSFKRKENRSGLFPRWLIIWLTLRPGAPIPGFLAVRLLKSPWKMTARNYSTDLMTAHNQGLSAVIQKLLLLLSFHYSVDPSTEEKKEKRSSFKNSFIPLKSSKLLKEFGNLGNELSFLFSLPWSF